MPVATVQRCWTLASWLVAGTGGDVETIHSAIQSVAADVVLLQSIRRSDAQQLAVGLGFNQTWALSHCPASRLIPGSAVGLAVLTPHQIGETFDEVVGEHRSKWSRHRRIGHTAAVVRDDHSSYTFGHSVAPADLSMSRPGSAPAVRVHPARIDGDASRAVDLPDGAGVVSLQTMRPIAGAAQLLALSFEMSWVLGDYSVE